MTLDEAITHCKEKAKELRETAKTYPNYKPYDKDHNDCLECAKEHEQLAGWLEELKEYKTIIMPTVFFPTGEKVLLTDGHIQALIDYERDQAMKDFIERFKKGLGNETE